MGLCGHLDVVDGRTRVRYHLRLCPDAETPGRKAERWHEVGTISGVMGSADKARNIYYN